MIKTASVWPHHERDESEYSRHNIHTLIDVYNTIVDRLKDQKKYASKINLEQ